MSWGTELWDQFGNLSVYTLKGIEFLERYSQFVKDRCAIENEYASKLRKLNKSYHLKKKEEDELQFSSCKAFAQMLNELNDVAGQHEMLSENLNLQVVKEVNILVKDLRDERKSYLQEGSNLQMSLQSSLNQAEKAKKLYEKLFKDSEKANENYQKALADLHLSRMDLSKSRQNSILKQQTCEVSKTDYISQLEKTNEAQRQHFSILMPKVYQLLQDMDEKRILSVQLFMKKTTGVQRQVMPLISKCLDEMDVAADSIDAKGDSELVISRYKSGFTTPGDLPFEELTITHTKVTDEDDLPNLLNKSDTIKGTISLPKAKKRGGIFSIFSTNKQHNYDDSKEDYSDLPPNQRKKKLTQKVDVLSAQLSQEYATRDGAMKLKATYEQNSALGDPETIDQELFEICNRIDKLELQLQKFQGYLADAEGKPAIVNDSVMKNGDNLSSASRNSFESANHVVVKSAPAVPLPRGTSTIGTNGNAMTNSEDQPEYGNSGNGEFEVEPLPALGTAKALYPFDAQSEGSIPMEEGEEFEVVELDQGDGWTRVRRSNMEEGFVPTTYIECSLYNSC